MITLLHSRVKYYLLFLLLICSVSCEKEANISIQEVDAQVVIISNFTPNEPFQLELSPSTSIFTLSNNTQDLENATVEICGGKNCQILDSQVSGGGNDNLNKFIFTSTKDKPVAGIEYSLNVKIEGMEEVSAEAISPEKVELTHVAVGAVSEIPLPNNPIDEKQYEVRVSLQFDDPTGEDNFYQINFYQQKNDVNGNLIAQYNDEGIEDFLEIDDDIIDIRNITDNGILLSDRHFDGQTRDLFFRPTFKFNPLTEMPVNLIVEFRTVSKDYYDYYSSVHKQVNQGSDPFSQPIEIISNINNGLGVFAGYSKDVMIREIEF